MTKENECDRPEWLIKFDEYCGEDHSDISHEVQRIMWKRCWEIQEKKIESLKAESEKLRKCVEFYADATNNPKQYMRQGYLVYNLKKKIFVDGGDFARATLKELNKERE